MKKYRGEIEPQAKGPEGRPIEFHPTGDQGAMVASVIERLCGKEEVPPQDVVVLSAHGRENSGIYPDLPGAYGLTDKLGQLGKHVYFSSIRGFKGLEAPVVILCELQDLDEQTLDSQLYVGLSRARNHCAIVAPAS